MLTPEELLEIVDTMYPHIDKLNNWIIKRCIEKINERIARGEDFAVSATDINQLNIYRDIGGFFDDVEAEMVQFTQTAQEEIRAIFEDAGIRAWTADENFYKAKGLSNSVPLLKDKRMMDILTDSYKRTNGEVRNLTRTTAEAVNDKLIETLDEAHMKVITGAQSYSEAYVEAINDICNYQAEVVYPSGHRDTVETAVLRAVRTGTAQASGNMTLAGMEEHDWDLIRVSAHLGARYGDGGENPGNHFWWQGKLYSKSGKDPRYPDFVTYTGYGTGEGLCGWNCRHSFGPGDPDHNPYQDYDEEENKRVYDLSQKQRAAERKIRHQKSKVMGLREAVDNAPDDKTKANLELDYQKEAYKLQKYNTEYNKLCSDFGLKKLSERITIAKWNRSEAVKATYAAKKEIIRSKILKEDVASEYLRNAVPEYGLFKISDGYKIGGHSSELKHAKWLYNNFGGNITLLSESKVPGEKSPDYLWRGRYWELKEVSSINAADKGLQKALKQISKNPGGVIIDFGKNECSLEKISETIDRRIIRSNAKGIDVFVLYDGSLIGAYRYK